VQTSVTSTAGRFRIDPVRDEVAGGGQFERCLRQQRGKIDADIVKHRLDVTRPADRDEGPGKEIFQREAPADRPRRRLTHRGMAVGIGAARYGHHRGEFGVAEPGEQADHARDEEGQGYGGSRMLGCDGARQHEYAGAHGAADAEADECEKPDGSGQPAGFDIALKRGNRLARERLHDRLGRCIFLPLANHMPRETRIRLQVML
jgi:hypothetical protein